MKFIYLSRKYEDSTEAVIINLDKVLWFEATRGGTKIIMKISDNTIDEITVIEDIVAINNRLNTI
ncbi:hypothetical protein PP749_gp073 [Rhizobium phage RHEph22]|uniref:Uncharacterized protein n=1 Tax=Rhizobium phage RHEph22 TaxID=2836135 RepID=A0AAE7VMX4_9CAUD|nr:hypothetical protein PP749_gp073 [Rhizobium phage RHEph22]QXV74746.1 hypothetical protein [Rhizobium phage RHEph22]QXV74840.1 hypothetical protein [Rhizobium phage RHEph24]